MADRLPVSVNTEPSKHRDGEQSGRKAPNLSEMIPEPKPHSERPLLRHE